MKLFNETATLLQKDSISVYQPVPALEKQSFKNNYPRDPENSGSIKASWNHLDYDSIFSDNFENANKQQKIIDSLCNFKNDNSSRPFFEKDIGSEYIASEKSEPFKVIQKHVHITKKMKVNTSSDVEVKADGTVVNSTVVFASLEPFVCLLDFLVW